MAPSPMRHIQTLRLTDGSLSYRVQVKLWWGNGVVRHAPGHSHASLEAAQRERDEIEARMRAEREAEREASDPAATVAIAEPPDEPDAWATFEHVQEVYRANSVLADEVSVSLPAEPVLVAFTSDWHVGHQRCDMPRLRRDLETVRDAHGAIRLILGGDLFSMALPTSVGGQFEEMMPPRMQRRLVEQAVSWVSDSVLAMILGNHDARSVAVADFDPVACLASLLAVPYIGGFGLLHVAVGDQRYNVLAAHKFRLGSSLNKTHAGKRMLDLVEDADAVFTGHTHDWAAEMTEVRRRVRFVGQAGAYQAGGDHGRSLGFNPAQARMPGAILFPDRHEMVGTWDAFGQGVHLLASYRRDVKCSCRYCREGRN